MSLDWATDIYLQAYSRTPSKGWTAEDEDLRSVIPLVCRKQMHMKGFDTNILRVKYQPVGSWGDYLRDLQYDYHLLFILDCMSLREGISVRDMVSIWTGCEGRCHVCDAACYPFHVRKKIDLDANEASWELVCKKCQ